VQKLERTGSDQLKNNSPVTVLMEAQNFWVLDSNFIIHAKVKVFCNRPWRPIGL
jgi:hypothetical protein